MTKYYFAYGSNMNFNQMNKRCPDARFITKAKLNGYKFVYDGYSKKRKGAVANIVEFKDKIVEGAVFEVKDDCIKKLDSHEGYPNSYQRKTVEVQGSDGNSYKAIVYLRNPLQVGQPSCEYKSIVLQGANDCGLSQSYIKEFIMV